MFKIYGITVKIQRSCGEQGTKLTFLPYVVKALVSALKNTQDLTLHSMKKSAKLYTNITGILVLSDTDRGLLVPVVKNADRKSIFQISDEINELAVKARDGKLTSDEMKGATCTISNIGSWWTMVHSSYQPPRSSYLRYWPYCSKPIVKDGEIVAPSISFIIKL